MGVLNCLGQHAPIISFKLKHKSHPCFNGAIKQRIIARKKLRLAEECLFKEAVKNLLLRDFPDDRILK